MNHRRIVWAAGLVALALAGCRTTEFHERELLQDRSMKFDQDGAVQYMRTKAEAAREGALGGFGSSTAGGCGCQ